MPHDDLTMLLSFDTIMFINMYKGKANYEKNEKYFELFMKVAHKYATTEMLEQVGSTQWFKTDIDRNPEMEFTM